MIRFFKWLSYLFLALVVYPVYAVFFLVKVVGLFLYKGAEEVVGYCHSILSIIEKQAK
jgi:hypothetical protein